MSLPQLDNLIWRAVPEEITKLVKAASPTYYVLRDVLDSIPTSSARVYYNPFSKDVLINKFPLEDNTKIAEYSKLIREVPNVDSISHNSLSSISNKPYYIRIKKADGWLSPLAHVSLFKDNPVSRLLGGPNPLVSSLGGSVLGGALGYGAGWLGEQVLPKEHFEKGKLRKTLAILGSLGGTIPGIMTAYDNYRSHPDPNVRGSWRALTNPHPLMVKENQYTPIRKGLDNAIKSELNELFIKYSDEAGGAFQPMIAVDQFNRVIWNDLRSFGGMTPPPIAAATTGITQAASLSTGANLISPMDVARIGMGMGSGYLSSLVVGKVLGALAGLKPESQRQLQQTGVWAGTLANTIPLAFGG